MSTRPAPVDPLAARKQNLLRGFYVSLVGCALAFAGVQYLRAFYREALLLVAVLTSALIVWTLVRFLHVIDEFEVRYIYGALRFAFVGMFCILVIETFLESLGFPRFPAYGNATCVVLLWSLGLAVTSWQRHWRRGYEE